MTSYTDKHKWFMDNLFDEVFERPQSKNIIEEMCQQLEHGSEDINHLAENCVLCGIFKNAFDWKKHCSIITNSKKLPRKFGSDWDLCNRVFERDLKLRKEIKEKNKDKETDCFKMVIYNDGNNDRELIVNIC